jgi:nucleoside-diphosphate-sugar epimerase
VAVAGDLTFAECGVGALDVAIDTVWHSAASLQYEDRHAEAIHTANVDGTRHVLALAQRLGARTFNHFSTAYVAGTLSGVLRETPASLDHVNNQYERSKVLGERLVTAAGAAMRTRIFRPSIVIGHTETYAATSFTGLYGFLRNLTKFQRVMSRAQDGLLERVPVKLRVDPTSRLNLIPVDHVVRDAVTVHLREAEGAIFHLTNSSPPVTVDVVSEMWAQVGLLAPQFVQDKAEFDWIDRKFSERIDFYESYLVGEKVFDRSGTDAVLGADAQPDFPMPAERLRAFNGWYIAHLEAQRAALPTGR